MEEELEAGLGLIDEEQGAQEGWEGQRREADVLKIAGVAGALPGWEGMAGWVVHGP